jgi:hypothetical protein
LQTPEQKADFIKLFGKNQYIKTLKQFAQQRLGPELIAGMTQDQIDNLSQKEYEERMDQIHADLGKVADPKKPVFAEVDVFEERLRGMQAQDLMLKRFGFERYMQSMGLSGLSELDSQAYHQVLDRPFKPYKTGSGSGRSNVAGDLSTVSDNKRSERV